MTAPRCANCGHEGHGVRPCPEIVGATSAVMPERIFCECADVEALYERIRTIEAAFSKFLTAVRIEEGECLLCGTGVGAYCRKTCPTIDAIFALYPSEEAEKWVRERAS